MVLQGPKRSAAKASTVRPGIDDAFIIASYAPLALNDVVAIEKSD
jgi:hypothetical protein